ncbi:MAG: DUF3747 domain-containing protein [Cyanobacteria bacterium]|nr:DUF3747 domain-containing protein [Cyanobacteriota bacterium]
MKRTYLALTGLLLAGTALAAALPPGSLPLARADVLFDSRPVEAANFAILARPVGDDDWNLLVLEQLRRRPTCWQQRPDGLVDPSLNRFDFTGICGRYLDSNGYSLRINRDDLAGSWRLRLVQRGPTLYLQASSVASPTELVVGRAEVARRDRDGFVALQLDPGWELQRRSFGNQALSHIYFANDTSLPQLIAQAAGELLKPPPAPPATAVAPQLARRSLLSRNWRQGSNGGSASSDALTPLLAEPGRTIALQVIPFKD